MRSIQYLIGHKAHSFADCLDLSRRQTPHRVKIAFEYEDCYLDFDILRRLVGRFSWEFEKGDIVCEQVYGSYFISSSEMKKQKMVSRANDRLAAHIAELRDMGIRFEKKEGEVFLSR